MDSCAKISPAATPPTASITRLRSTDAESYRALMLEAYAAEPEAFTSTAAEREPLPIEWWGERIERAAIFGAFAADRLVGVAGLRPGSRERTSHKATLFGMFVEPGARGRGLGRALVKAVLEHARRTPALRLVQLTVTESNPSALALYVACGFERFGQEPLAVRVAGGYVTKLHLWHDLGEHPGRPAGGGSAEHTS